MKEFFMKSRFARIALVVLAALFVTDLCLVDADAQSRRKRRARRVTKPPVVRPVITNPPITPPEGEQGGDVKIVSTADETGVAQSERTSGSGKKSDEQD